MTEVSQLVSITLVFGSEKMSVDRENWMVNWPIVTANMSQPSKVPRPMRAFDMQGLIGYVSLITCNQSLFDHAPDECGFYTIAIRSFNSKVNSNFRLIDFLYFGLPHTRTGRGRCSRTDSICQVMYTPIWINYSSLCSLSRIGHHLVHTSKSSLSWFSVPFSEFVIMPRGKR